MTAVVITLIGDDQAGLVDAVAASVARHGGNWERSHLAELAGKFAGIVLVEVGSAGVEPLLSDLNEIQASGLLAITAERAATPTAAAVDTTHVALELVGQDHVGIVHEISQLLARHNVSIEELETATAPAPQGGDLFIAHAVLELPAGLMLDELRVTLESVTHDLMVDLDLIGD